METFRDTLGKFMVPAGRLLAAMGIHPHVLSISGIVFGVLSGYLFVTGHLAWAVTCFVLSGLSDVVDGMVARARGMASPFGSFFDNFCSAYTDSAAFAGLILAGLCTPFWGLGALLGTFARLLTWRLDGIVSRDEGQALRSRFPHALSGKGDRIVLVGLGVVFGRVDLAMAIIAISTNAIAFYRCYHLWRLTSTPQPTTSVRAA
jgi:CDP-diacylglycerol--glycerol-3-phosphate 3-phosphatidyltransferase